jgi:hypothetical protein
VAPELLLIAGMTRLTVIKKRMNDPHSRYLMIDELIDELVRKQLRDAHAPRLATVGGVRPGLGKSCTRGAAKLLLVSAS